jgi:hypothetical protein
MTFYQCCGSGSIGTVCYVPSRSGSVRLRYLDPYRYQNVTDPQHGASPKIFLGSVSGCKDRVGNWLIAAAVTMVLVSRRGLLEAMSIQSTVYTQDHANVLIWVKGS